ncbi:MAG TPA: hypothetical protein VFZ21_29765 [Gemmatimonadaceae bacterium]|jgi:hypothetical protein|nr:hypothetical protein [Gemmatimonadaceae bacterium]
MRILDTFQKVLIAGAAICFVGNPVTAVAQARPDRPIGFSLGAGAMGQPSASRFHPFGFGLAAVAGAEIGRASVVGLRAEGTGFVRLNGGSGDTPLCAPGGVCVGRKTADAVAIASLSARVRVPSTPAYALIGVDYIYAPSTLDPGPSSTSGFNAGLGWSMGRAGRRTLEARYHAPRRDLGLTRSLVDITLRFRVGA